MGELWLWALSSAGVALSWLWYRSCRHSADLLKELVPLSAEAAEQATKSDAAPLVHFVGNINSDAPVVCTHASGTLAVIYKMDHTLHVTRWDETKHKWVEVERSLGSASRVVSAWVAPDPATVPRISISDEALSRATVDFELPIVEDKFVATGDDSLLTKFAQYAQGELPRGTRIVERALTVGTPVTVIGRLNAVNGKYVLLSPNATEDGILLISKRDKNSILRSFRSRADFAFWFSVALTTGLLGWLLYRAWKRRQVPRAASPVTLLGTNDNSVHPTIGGGSSGASSECVICMDRPRAAVILPCGHFHTCLECTSSLTECPVCRGRIEQVVRTFG